MINLTAHEPGSPLPCLCKACFDSAVTAASASGLSFRRVTAATDARELHAWVPEPLWPEEAMLVRSMEYRLRTRSPTLGWGERPKREPLAVAKVRDPAVTAKPGLLKRLRNLFR